MNASSDVVLFDKVGDVGVIRISYPPVNALGSRVCKGLTEALRAAIASGVKAVLVRSEGSMFSAGADISEFNAPGGAANLLEVEAEFENAPVPVVAAIHGVALGGGLEFAMACHYRIAHPGARLGLPEITLGVVPGAGGTQRLPRLVGAAKAFNMMLTGAPASAAEAKDMGLVDEVAEGDLAQAALDYCARLIAEKKGPRPTSARPVDASGFDQAGIDKALQANAKALKGRSTQFDLVTALQAAATKPFKDGIEVEKVLARESIDKVESRALRHIFFAERAVGKIKGLPQTKAPVRKAAVIGAGTMGAGIATAFISAGVDVVLIDNAQEGIDRGLKIINSTFESSVKRGRTTQAAADAALARLKTGLDVAAVADVDLVIEAVFEDMNIKKDVLGRIDKVLPGDKLLASNTSTLSVTELGRATAHPSRVVGLHFFSPANVMRLLEIVRGDDTSLDALATSLQVAKLLKKIGVVAGDRFGFIGNRMMLDGYFREAELLLLEGATVPQVDNALEAFGFAMGPSRVNDLGGNDVGEKARRELLKRETRPAPYSVIADELTHIGKLGQKTGSGFYKYGADKREAIPDPEVEQIIQGLAAKYNIKRGTVSDKEIVERCVLALINVGGMVLDEGIAASASDIDVVWTSGYGFPRYVGGPMFYADTLGLKYVAERLRFYHDKYGHYWKPSKLILDLAAAGSSFEQWDRERSGDEG